LISYINLGGIVKAVTQGLHSGGGREVRAVAEFHTFLREQGWPSPPVLVGRPTVGVLTEVLI